MAKLTKAQREAIAAMLTWRRGMAISTDRLSRDGVRAETMRSLARANLVSHVRDANGVEGWRLLDAGRAQLSENSNAR